MLWTFVVALHKGSGQWGRWRVSPPADASTLPNDMLFLDDSGDVQTGNREKMCNREKVSAFDRVMRETVAAKL